MEAFIDATLRRVVTDFDATKAQAGRLCDCKTLTYEGGNAPNYDTPLVQQIYMLRYFPAYLAEYYLIQNSIKLVNKTANFYVDASVKALL